MIRQKTGLALSPYFPASKLTWLKENVEGAKELAKKHALCFGTIDTWLVYRMTHGTSYKTDYSNASRTQLFDIFEQRWDEEICQLFGLDAQDLAEVCDSDSCFGETDLEGFFENPISIHSVLGDSHGALFGQGCLEKGMIKSTYGTGSSIMMNIGETPVLSTHGVVTSLAWGMQGKVSYVLEGNINYTGAVISWLKDDMELIQSPSETEGLCRVAEADDSLYFVPAFTGLGAPYWNSEAKRSADRNYKNHQKGRNGACRSRVYCISDRGCGQCHESGCEHRNPGTACGRRTNQKSVSDAVSERYPEPKGACAGCGRTFRDWSSLCSRKRTGAVWR